VARAKSLLERAAGGGHLPAVYLLVELLDREGALDKAIELLKVSYPSNKFHSIFTVVGL